MSSKHMDNLTLAGMLHVCLSICWMRAQVPDSIVETNRAHSDSEYRKTKEQDRNILLLPNKSFSNKDKGTEICNRNSVICVLVPPILKGTFPVFKKIFTEFITLGKFQMFLLFLIFLFLCFQSLIFLLFFFPLSLSCCHPLLCSLSYPCSC